MADDNDASSKTEEATPRKLEEARSRGEVPKSADVTSWASLAAVVGVVLTMGGWFATNLAGQLRPFIAHPDAFRLADGGAVQVMRMSLVACAPVIAAVMGAAALASVSGSVLQHGFLFTPSRLAPDLSRLSPLKGIERMFGIDGLVQFL